MVPAARLRTGRTPDTKISIWLAADKRPPPSPLLLNVGGVESM